MKLKNISGRTLSVGVGDVCVPLAHNATGTFGDDADSVRDALKWIKLELLELVEAPASAELQQTVDVEDSLLLLFTGQPTDGQILTINGVNFEADDNAAVTAGNIAVTIGGSVAATAATLQTAINANATLAALFVKLTDKITVGASDVRAVVRGLGTTLLVQSENWGNATISAVAAVENQGYRQVFRTYTAAATTILCDTGLQTIVSAVVTLRTAAGVVKAYDGVMAISDGLIYLDASGNVDVASTDLVVVQAVGK